ncbi:hypothetical protein BTHI11S_00603 [Bosea thiooxidans]
MIQSEGRAYPIETRYRGRDPLKRIEDQVTETILLALNEQPGSQLVFLPGQGEIRRVEERLREKLRDPAVEIAPLYGALDQRDQDRAVLPAPAGRRKIVLATAIAKTSLTIEGVRVVIDSGLARVPATSPISASPGWRPVASAAPPPISAGAAPAAPSRASATGSGRRPRRARSRPSPGPRSCPPI